MALDFCAMAPAPSRRDILQLLAGSAVGMALPVAAEQARPALDGGRSAVSPHASPLTLSRLTDTLSLVSGAGGNVLVLDGPDGVLMVNGGLEERSADLQKLLGDQFAGKKVRTLFNTDWHPEHTGSNEAIGRGGAQIVAHEHTREYLGTEIFVDWQNRTYKPRPVAARPTKTFLTTGKMMHGEEPIEYGHLGQAHTDGDIYVYFPRANVLAAGDVLTVGQYPIGDYTTGGWLGGLAIASKTLADLGNAETRVVPGVGPLQTRADLQGQQAMLTSVRDRLSKMMRQGMSAKEMLAAGATKEFDSKWGNPDLFVTTAYRSMWLHVREVGGVV